MVQKTAIRKKPIPKDDGLVKFHKCNGPLESDCEHCPYIKSCYDNNVYPWVMIPHFITDIYMKKTTNPAWKVFMFLTRKANFKTDSKNYARCWLTHKQISKGTGVAESNMSKYIKELRDLKLIKYYYHRENRGDGLITFHDYTVLHLIRMREMKRTIFQKSN